MQVRFSVSVELNETQPFLRVVTLRIAFEAAPGDVVQAGVVASSSEVGCGMLPVHPLVFWMACWNGMIASNMPRKTHVGRALDSEETTSVVFKDDTLRAGDQVFLFKVGTW